MLDFLCIGAQKSATTWLYATLSRHPGIAFPGGKEVHFWNHKYSNGIDWYFDVFSDDKHTNGDITPAYSILPKEVIKKIYRAMPHLRIIYLIRNPMERAWSSACMALARAEMEIDEASDQWFIDHFMSKGSLARGDYETCIRNWLEFFPSEQLFVLRYEVIQKEPILAANKILNFIGHKSFFEFADEVHLNKKVFKGNGDKIRPSLLLVLDDIYKERINALGRYLQEDFSNWKIKTI